MVDHREDDPGEDQLKRYRLTPTPCPNCGTLWDTAEDIHPTPRHPKPGDPLMCPKCGVINILAEDMKLRSPTPAELERAMRTADRLLKEKG